MAQMVKKFSICILIVIFAIFVISPHNFAVARSNKEGYPEVNLDDNSSSNNGPLIVGAILVVLAAVVLYYIYTPQTQDTPSPQEKSKSGNREKSIKPVQKKQVDIERVTSNLAAKNSGNLVLFRW